MSGLSGKGKLPSSPRNQIILQFLNGKLGFPKFESTVEHLLHKDWTGDVVLVTPPDPPEVDEDAPPTKRRRYAIRQLSITPQTLCERMNVKYSDVQSCAVKNSTIFKKFQFNIISVGLVQWRKHSTDQDVVVLNDYCQTSAVLLPLDYVHVYASMADEELLIKCTCKIYRRIHCLALVGCDLEAGEEAVLSNSSTCMHCRFFRTHLHGCMERLEEQETSTPLLSKVREGLENVNNPVVVLGSPNQVTTKFSVFGGDNYSMITFIPMAPVLQNAQIRCVSLT